MMSGSQRASVNAHCCYLAMASGSKALLRKCSTKIQWLGSMACRCEKSRGTRAGRLWPFDGARARSKQRRNTESTKKKQRAQKIKLSSTRTIAQFQNVFRYVLYVFLCVLCVPSESRSLARGQQYPNADHD